VVEKLKERAKVEKLKNIAPRSLITVNNLIM
jgi:hypothetical protein